MKTYCKNLVVDEAFVAEAYDRWRHNEAGCKNAWRVDRDYGCADNLIAEIAREMNDGTLEFEPLKTYPRNEDGKVRDIGIEPGSSRCADTWSIWHARSFGMQELAIGRYLVLVSDSSEQPEASNDGCSNASTTSTSTFRNATTTFGAGPWNVYSPSTFGARPWWKLPGQSWGPILTGI